MKRVRFKQGTAQQDPVQGVRGPRWGQSGPTDTLTLENIFTAPHLFFLSRSCLLAALDCLFPAQICGAKEHTEPTPAESTEGFSAARWARCLQSTRLRPLTGDQLSGPGERPRCFPSKPISASVRWA